MQTDQLIDVKSSKYFHFFFAAGNHQNLSEMAHLSAGKINFSAFRELARKDLVALLEKYPGTKVIKILN